MSDLAREAMALGPFTEAELARVRLGGSESALGPQDQLQARRRYALMRRMNAIRAGAIG